MAEVEEAIGVVMDHGEVAALVWVHHRASGVEASDHQEAITAEDVAATEAEEAGLIRKESRPSPLPLLLACWKPRRDCQSSERTPTIRTTSHLAAAISKGIAFSEALEVAMVSGLT